MENRYPEPFCDEPATPKLIASFAAALTASVAAGIGGPVTWIAYGATPALLAVATCLVVIGALFWWVS